MLFWMKCLLCVYDVSIVMDALIPLYLNHSADLDFLECAGVIAGIQLLGLWSTAYFTKREIDNDYYHWVIVLFAIFGTLSYIILFVFDSYIWVYVLFNGLFYQPLQTLIDTAVIKVLGDFRVLFYASFISQSKILGFIVLSLLSFNEFDISIPLLVITCVSSTLVLFISLFFIRVETANSDQLDISQDQAPLLLKNARTLITEHQQWNAIYKPYSLFAQQLSHISEEMIEDEEVIVDRIETRDSYFSFRSSVPPPQPSTPPCHALCFFFTVQNKDPLTGLFISKEEDDMTGLPVIIKVGKESAGENWKRQTLKLCVLCLGISKGWILYLIPLYHFYILELSMSVIISLILAYNIGEWVSTFIVDKYFQRLNLILVTTCMHIVFILYVLMYPYLKVIPALLFSLQFTLGAGYQCMWLSSSKAVNMVTETYYERMKLRSIMSCLYTCVGPSIGVLAIACCMDSIQDYAFLMNQCLFLFLASFLISWGWSL